MQFVLLIIKSLRRNLLRTFLTAMGTLVLVFVLTLIWSILDLLDNMTAEKNQNLKLIVTEKWQLPSQMPFRYSQVLETGAAEEPGDVKPIDSMNWEFFLGSIEPDATKRSIDNFLFAFSLEPIKLATMMDELDSLTGKDKEQLLQGIAAMEDNQQGIIVGVDRLKKLKKKVGDQIQVYGTNYKDIKLDFKIVGSFPESVPRYAEQGAMNSAYLRRALNQYENEKKTPHPLASKSLALVWLKVATRADYEQIAAQIERSPALRNPTVKCETASSGIANFLEMYRDLLWGMRYLLAPAIVVTLSLVISNAISISVRERRTEFAVLKVLGFQPLHILLMVLGESLAVGLFAGTISAVGTYVGINYVLGGVRFPIAFIPAFTIPIAALWWGMGVGVITAIAGSIVPALAAMRTNVAQVFAKVC